MKKSEEMVMITSFTIGATLELRGARGPQGGSGVLALF